MRTEIVAAALNEGGNDLVTVSADVANGNFVSWVGGGHSLLFGFFAVIPCNVTIRVPMMVDDDLTVGDRVIALTPGTVKLWLCDTPSIYMQANGQTYFDFSAACSVGILVV